MSNCNAEKSALDSMRAGPMSDFLSDKDGAYKFMAGEEGVENLCLDPTTVLLAICLINQQAAGFRFTVDLRKFACPNCGAAGFNTGWGCLWFTCGAEVVGDDFSEPCEGKSA